MKKLIYLLTVVVSCGLVKVSHAQVRISLGANINYQPDWGPVGYDHADYYYLPDIDAYYSIPDHQYVYYRDNRWVHATYLPPAYAGYDLYHGYKVVVNERDPWLHADIYRSRYARYKGRHDQVIIRDSRDEKYRNHWVKKEMKQEEKGDKKEMKQDAKADKKEIKREEKQEKHGDY